MLIIAVPRSPVVAGSKIPGICDEIPFPQSKRVASLSFPELSELLFPALYRRSYSFPSRRLEWKNLLSHASQSDSNKARSVQ